MKKYEMAYHNYDVEAKRAARAKIICSNRTFGQNNRVRSKQ